MLSNVDTKRMRLTKYKPWQSNIHSISASETELPIKIVNGGSYFRVRLQNQQWIFPQDKTYLYYNSMILQISAGNVK